MMSTRKRNACSGTRPLLEHKERVQEHINLDLQPTRHVLYGPGMVHVQPV